MPAITRRGAFAQTAALLSLPALAAVPAGLQTTPAPVRMPPIGAVPADHPDAELIGTCRQFFEADRLFNAHPADKHPTEAERAMAQWYATLERATSLIPTTPEGMAAKLHVALTAMESVGIEEGYQREEAAALAVLRHLAGRAGA